MKKMWKVAIVGASVCSVGLVAAPLVNVFASSNTAWSSMSSNDLLNGKLFGNIPNVTVRGVPAGAAPWVVNGHITLTKSKLMADGKWLIVPKTGYLANGKPIPSAIAGTTVGKTSVGAEITFANAPAILVKSVPLSKTGDFTMNAPVKIPSGAKDPVVLIGPVANGKMQAWFASSNFLMDYGSYASGAMSSANNMSIDVNGKSVQNVSGYAKVDPSTNKPTTYMPIWYIMKVLKQLGLTSSWNGSTWNITNGSSNSTMGNSTASNSTASNSTASNSTASNSTASNSTASNSTMGNSTASNSTMGNSTMGNSTMSNSTMSNSTMSNSTMSNSTMSNSTMSNSTTGNATAG